MSALEIGLWAGSVGMALGLLVVMVVSWRNSPHWDATYVSKANVIPMAEEIEILQHELRVSQERVAELEAGSGKD